MVNNAGTTHRNQPMLDVTEEQFDRVYAVNVKSLFWSAKHCVPGVSQAGRRRIRHDRLHRRRAAASRV